MAEFIETLRGEDCKAAAAAKSWPRYLDRKQAAAYVSERWFHTTARAIERWPISVYRVGKKALHEREELDQIAEGTIQASLVRAA